MARYTAAGRQISCTVCGGGDFKGREVLLNTSGMSFFDLDWANKSAEGLICTQCGYIQLFMPEMLDKVS
jgi:predicted nucleic-acid-binding Zn-ribbon protein